jgi:hypothetical protein
MILLKPAWRGSAVLSVVDERVVFLQLDDFGLLRILPHGVVILPVYLYGLIVSLWD